MKLFSLVAMALAAGSSLAGGTDAVRVVQGGILRGELADDGSAVFRRIPFAAPPIGERRWATPQPVAPWSGALDVRGPVMPCPQLDEGWNAANVAAADEDCLSLAIREPKHPDGARLPVFVWIHGGSNRAGSGAYVVDSPIYKQRVVVVGIEYRLGVLGFLASPELSKESRHHSSGNYALLDQIAALAWIRANIAKFGGDPQNVTVGGQSAGAVDIAQLLRSPLARSLFSKAILESGSLSPPRSAADNEAIGTSLMGALGLAPGDAGLSTLRRSSVADLLSAGVKLRSPTGSDPSILWIEASADGWVLPAGSNLIDRRGGQLNIPMIVGNNTQEFIFDGSDEQARQMVAGMFGKNQSQALHLYGFDTPTAMTRGAPDDRGTRVLTDVIFRCSSIRLASWPLVEGKKVWRYEFGIPRPGSARVEHNAELDYVFGDEKAHRAAFAWPPLQKYWVNFFKTGNPNAPDLPAWPHLGSKHEYIAVRPDETRATTETREEKSICELLAGAQG